MDSHKIPWFQTGHQPAEIHDKNGQFPISKERTIASTENGWTFIPGQVDQIPTSSHHVDGSMAEHPSKTIPQKLRILWELSVPPNPLQNP